MEFCNLGTTSCAISRLGFGCGPASGYDYGPIDESAWIAAIRGALDHSINFFDVADVYGFGRVEELLSRALEERRHEVVIATKGGLVWDEKGCVSRNSSRKQITRAIEDSLRRLRVDVISLYQIHWPDPVTRIEETFETLRDLQDQGKIRFIGVSNFPLELLQQACRICRIDSQQVAYNLLCRDVESNVLPWCDARQISVLAHTGLARGLLAGKRRISSRFDGLDTRARSPYFSAEGRTEKEQLLGALTRLSEHRGRTVCSIALRWILDNPQIAAVLVGMKDQAQLEENLKAVDWRLDQPDREILLEISAACPQGLAGAPAHAAASR
jgi:aryl-alcohol dehydrogenase-like predicted oxidoreductase